MHALAACNEKYTVLQTTELLAPYLPAEGRTVSPYSEGGALFALGLIHASHGQPVVEFISNSLSNTHNEVVQHGACLGLGLASQGSDDPLLYEKLKGTAPSPILDSVLCFSLSSYCAIFVSTCP